MGRKRKSRFPNRNEVARAAESLGRHQLPRLTMAEMAVTNERRTVDRSRPMFIATPGSTPTSALIDFYVDTQVCLELLSGDKERNRDEIFTLRMSQDALVCIASRHGIHIGGHVMLVDEWDTEARETMMDEQGGPSDA